MKKLLCILLAVIMVFSFAACGGDDSSDENNGDDKNTSKAEYTISEQVISDTDQAVFKIVSVENNDSWGTVDVKVYCENKTADQELMFSWDQVSVNGYMVDPFWAESVTAGSKSNSDISFSTSDFELCGFETMEEIQFVLRISDNNDFMADPIVEKTFTVYPTGLSEYTTPERTPVAGETVIVNNDDVEFTVVDVDPESFWGYTLTCYIENKTGDNLMFSWDGVSVNDYMIDPFWADTVTAGNAAYATISFFEDDLIENNIETVESIEFILSVSDADDWMADDILEETYVYTPAK